MMHVPAPLAAAQLRLLAARWITEDIQPQCIYVRSKQNPPIGITSQRDMHPSSAHKYVRYPQIKSKKKITAQNTASQRTPSRNAQDMIKKKSEHCECVCVCVCS